MDCFALEPADRAMVRLYERRTADVGKRKVELVQMFRFANEQAPGTLCHDYLADAGSAYAPNGQNLDRVSGVLRPGAGDSGHCSHFHVAVGRPARPCRLPVTIVDVNIEIQ